LFIVSDDLSIAAWDIESGRLLAAFHTNSHVKTLAVLPDRTVIAGDQLGRVHFLRLEAPK
jgi:hypothetical protein